MTRPITLLLLVFTIGVLQAQSKSGGRPNVILIVTDDQGYGDMSCHGNPWVKTPNLDRLKSQSVCLEDYHVDPVCTPTRAALMTGRYCTRVGAWAVTEGRQLLNPKETTTAQVFAGSGYRTGMFGKWHLGDPYPFAPQFRGFQDVVCHRAGGVDEIGNPTGNDYFDDTYYRNGVPERFEGYCTDIWFNETLRFIREPSGMPFFVYLPTNAMHGPFTVAERYWKPFAALGMPEDRAKFYGMITNFDENLGRLMDTLKDNGLERNTILIFMGDNGTAQGIGSGQQATDGFNAGMRGKKGSVYEGGHRVACFARWPAQLEAGLEVDALTSHRDWLPTLIELCDLESPRGLAFDGQSIAPLLKDDAELWPQRTLFIERQADELEMGRLDSKAVPFAVLTEQWRLVNGQLFDIIQDPGQSRNLAAQHPEVAKELYAAYQAHYAEISESNEPVRFQIGAHREEPIHFTVRDWHPTKGRVIWKPEQLGDETLFINGWWGIEVLQRGRYAIRLSRFAFEDDKPMGAEAARIQLGDSELQTELDPGASSVTFEAPLDPGPLTLKTWLMDAETGKERGAYHIEIEPLGTQ